MGKIQLRTINFFFAVLLLVTMAFLSCTAMDRRPAVQDQSTGQLSLYLSGPERASLDIRFTLVGATLISETGLSREITDIPQTIHSLSIRGRQVLLGERNLPEGTYHKVRLLVSNATIIKNDSTASLALPQDGIEIPATVTINSNKSASLFLLWNIDASITNSYMFSPALSVRQVAPDVSSLLVYVTNENSNSVSVISRQSDEVVSNIMVGKKPRGIAASAGREHTRIYVANSGSNSISVIDPNSQTVENEIPVRFGREPEGIAVCRMSAEHELVFVTNFSSDSVSVFDTASYQEVEKVSVGRSPVAIAADPPDEDLSGARFLNFEEMLTLKNYRERFCNIYVANYNSNSVSVISMNLSTLRSSEVTTLNVDWNPIALFVDYPRGKVYVANYGSDRISVINILELIKGNGQNAVSEINHVAYSVTGIISDPVLDRLYLLKQNPNEIIILRPFDSSLSSLQTIMPPVIGVIRVGSGPRAFVLDSEGRKFFIANQGSNTLSVVDKISKKEETTIPVGAKPYGIALLSE